MLENSISINQLVLKNRLYLPPMASRLVGDPLVEYYRKITAPGRFGLVIVEHAYVHKSGQANAIQISADEDTDMDTLKKVVETIHASGAAAFAQINHAGARGIAADPGSASPVKNPRDLANPDRKIPHAMEPSEITEVIRWFTEAALRCKEAGYDGVEIHSAHGYLLNQFYSPLTNHRDDAYGGCVENRVRLHTGILRSARRAVGDAYPVIIRLGACDYMEGGSTELDAVIASRLFEEAGADAIDVSGGLIGYVRPGWEGFASFRDVSEDIKKAVSVPVMLTGGITARDQCEELLSRGEADMIGIARPVLADPAFIEGIL